MHKFVSKSMQLVHLIKIKILSLNMNIQNVRLLDRHFDLSNLNIFFYLQSDLHEIFTKFSSRLVLQLQVNLQFSGCFPLNEMQNGALVLTMFENYGLV